MIVDITTWMIGLNCCRLCRAWLTFKLWSEMVQALWSLSVHYRHFLMISLCNIKRWGACCGWPVASHITSFSSHVLSTTELLSVLVNSELLLLYFCFEYCQLVLKFLYYRLDRIRNNFLYIFFALNILWPFVTCILMSVFLSHARCNDFIVVICNWMTMYLW